MAKNGNIYLIGPMGCGKTAVGKALARRLGRRFVDTDCRVERKARETVSDLFAKRGEAAFRRLEREAVRRLAKGAGRVIALGGGAPCQREVRQVLASTGVTVRLTCRQDVLWRRLAPEREKRPLLRAPTAAQGKARLAALIRRREAGYPKGELRVSTSGRTAAQAAGRIARLLARRPPDA